MLEAGVKEKGEREGKREGETETERDLQIYTADFEDGRRGIEPRNALACGNRKWLLLYSPGRNEALLAHFTLLMFRTVT
jgi:hypothetical protein